MTEKGVTLTELLDSRDRRHQRQLDYLKKYPNDTLLVLTIVMPGSVKRNHLSLITAHAAVDAINNNFNNDIIESEIRDLITGYEAFFVVKKTSEESKRIACNIEDTHPLGRLFDIDILSSNGIPVSRTQLQIQPRRCLICGDDARVCMRTQKHNYDQLLEHINNMVNVYSNER